MDLHQNQDVQQLLSLFAEHKPDKAQDLSALLFYVDGMERQFDSVLAELQNVKAQLAEMQDAKHPIKNALEKFVQGLENKLAQMRERLFEIKENIADAAAKLVEDVKQTGITALDKSVSFLGVREGLDLLRTGLDTAMQQTKNQIQKVENMGQELRSVGTHMKNVGRAAAGMELKTARQEEGQFQAAVLAPTRATHNALVLMTNATLTAVGSVERLERAAAQVREQKEKPSIRQGLKDFKEQAAQAAPGKQDLQKTEAR